MMKAVLLLYNHCTDDDRYRYHLHKALTKHNVETSLVSAMQPANDENDHQSNTFTFDKSTCNRLSAILKMMSMLKKINPDTIICDSPQSVLAAFLYKRKHKNTTVIYDVTEWYPSKKNLTGKNNVANHIKSHVLKMVNELAGKLSDKFIFGEHFKSLNFQRLCNEKPFVFVSYYPDLQYFNKTNIIAESGMKHAWKLCYCGNITEEKGFYRVVEVVKGVAEALPNIQIDFNVITGRFSADAVAINNLPHNVNLNFAPFKKFDDFCNYLYTNDFYFDLRDRDEENDKCLPIKLFYYMASGKPVVYSDLQAIRQGVEEYEQVGCFVDNDNLGKAVSFVVEAIKNPDLYAGICKRALHLSQTKYNWSTIEERFILFIIK